MPAAGRALRAALVAAALGAAAGRPAAAQPAAQLPALPGFGGRVTGAAARAAREAQRRFELARRRLLPPYRGQAAARCDVQIGRLCYWDNNTDGRPPAETPAGRRALRALTAELARAAAADSADDWIAGQRVRYLVELARAESDSADARRPAPGGPAWLRAGQPDSVAPAASLPTASLPAWRAADSAAAACRGTPWWCEALAGLVHHAAGRHAPAVLAFDRARALLPDAAARCAWDDLSPWLPDRARGDYRRLACGSPERSRYEARAWRLAQPFWTLDANDLRAELAARRVLVRLHGAGEHPQALPWGEDLATSDVRYGVPVAWSVRDPVGVNGFPSVVGHEATPSYDFWPDARALAAGALLADPPRLPDAGAWALRRAVPQSRYAPAYAAAGVYALPHQLARFRRGDTLFVVGAYDAAERGDSVPPGTGTGPVRAGFVLYGVDVRGRGDAGPAGAPDSPHVMPNAPGAPDGRPAVARVLREAAPRQGSFLLRAPPPAGGSGGQPAAGASPADSAAPAAGWLAGLEVLDTGAVRYADGAARRGRAGRARGAVRPLAPGARFSDLLLVRPGLAAAAAPSLALAADSALGSASARAGQAVGLFWEQYAAPGAASGAADTVVITATRLDPSLLERLGAIVGRPVVLRAVRARYAVGAGSGAVTARAVSLTWPAVPPGAYRLEVSTPARPGEAPASTSVTVQVSR